MSFCALVCAITVPGVPTQALGDGLPPWAICANNKEATELSTPHLAASPANGATVLAGTAVTFSVAAGSNRGLTFSVASSPALLSTPDIDSGPGSLQPGTSLYTFTSTKATATPRTIYWTASFTFTPEDCEKATTFTTPARTLTVISPPPTAAEAATKKQQEEEAKAKKKREEEAPIGTGSVSKPNVKALTRAQRLAAALEACHKKGRKHRMVCERRARRAYGPLHKKK